MEKPNVIVFMTDHQRWDTIHPFNRAKTPNLDKMALESTVFTNAYCTAPHCCPSRASFFSGLYPSEHGVWNNVDVGNTLSEGLKEGVVLLPEILRENGYKCMFSGKWHVSAVQGPEDRGFEDCFNFGIEYGKNKPEGYEWDLYYKNNRFEKICTGEETRGDGQIIRPGYPLYTQYGTDENPFADGTVTQHAVDMIENHRKEGNGDPLFLFTGVLGPHDPYNVPEEFENMYDIEDIELPENFYDDMQDKPGLYKRVKEMFSALTPEEHKKSILKYLAFCSYEDHLFGRILKQARKLEGRTVIIYLSDHGDYMGEHGLWAKGLPCFDGAYHIPLVVFDTEDPVYRLEDKFVSLVDMFPTILDLCNIKSNLKFSGKTLVPFMRGEKNYFIRDCTYTQSNGNELYGIQRSVKNKDYKLVYNGFDNDEFYDLRKDPLETKNLFNNPEYSGRIKEMYKKLWRFAYEKKDVCINPYIFVGLSEYGPGIIFQED